MAPGPARTDTALALSIAHVMIERGWFDREFVRDWTNAPLLVREDSGRLLREEDINSSGETGKFVASDAASGLPVTFDPKHSIYDVHSDLALVGNFDIPTPRGSISCRPVFALLADLCRRYEPKAAEAITGIDASAIEATAQLLWEARPVAYYAWSGIEQHTNTTQMARAIAQICVLTGGLDVPGGNVLFAGVPVNPIDGAELLSREQRAKALGLPDRPLGPSRWEFVTSGELYDAALDARPYKVRGESVSVPTSSWRMPTAPVHAMRSSPSTSWSMPISSCARPPSLPTSSFPLRAPSRPRRSVSASR